MVAHGASVTLMWEENPDPSVVGYRVYLENQSDSEVSVLDVGEVTRFTLQDLEEGDTYAFRVTSYNRSGLESAPSNKVEYSVSYKVGTEPRVSNMKMTRTGVELRWTTIEGATYRVLAKDDLSAREWQVVGEFMAGGTSAYFQDTEGRTAQHRFYLIEQVP
jgi:fibronectin type 3 domain-containing protein